MSLKENDIYFEGLMNDLNDLNGVWYENETLEEAVERSAWCDKNLGKGSRRRMAEILGYQQHRDFKWRNFREVIIAKNPTDEEMDRGDEEYHAGVDDELSFSK